MSSIKEILPVDDSSTEALLLDAAARLHRGGDAVLLNGQVVLVGTDGYIRCEVVDPAPGSHRCAEELRVLEENAARALAGSRLAPLLPQLPLRWVQLKG